MRCQLGAYGVEPTSSPHQEALGASHCELPGVTSLPPRVSEVCGGGWNGLCTVTSAGSIWWGGSLGGSGLAGLLKAMISWELG